MDPVFYMSENVFVVIMIAVLCGLGFTCVLLLSMLVSEIKNKTVW